MTRALCNECGSEGIPVIWWKDDDDNEVTGDGINREEHQKMVARECTGCGNYWEYEVNAT